MKFPTIYRSVKRQKCARQFQKGSALLEALIAILLFSIGILGMAGLQGRAAKMGADAEDRTLAALLADEVVAEMWMQQAQFMPPNYGAWQARVANSSLAGAVGAISAPDANGTVTISIQWAPPTRLAGGAGVKTAQYTTQVNLPL
jgi:type IV pilus assembly protein PilV